MTLFQPLGRLRRRRRSPFAPHRVGLLVALLAALVGQDASAQSNYPDHVVKMIAPQPPGGGVDLVGRLLADHLSRALGQSFIIDNEGGAGGVIAAQQTVRAAPDGYTLMVAYVGTHGTGPAVRKTSYDARKDFTPIAMIGGVANVLVESKAVPAANLAAYVAYARAHPAELSYGTSGNGTLNHLVMEQFKQTAQFPSLSVAYRSMGQAITDLIGGQIQTVFPGVATALPHIRAGNLKPLAVTGEKRHPLLPDVPTFKELGHADLDALTWYGVVGPANMPPAIVGKLNAEINRILASAEFKDKLTSEGVETMPMSARDFGAYIASDIARWTRVARESHIQLD
jgi:tripartite-type tricarboxylate transporter receptor subunit TctC